MRIKYIHASDPETVKTHDTEKAYKNMAWARSDPNTKLYHKSQAEFDKIYLEIFERDKARGLILGYAIISNTPRELPDFTSAAAFFCETD